MTRAPHLFLLTGLLLAGCIGTDPTDKDTDTVVVDTDTVVVDTDTTVDDTDVVKPGEPVVVIDGVFTLLLGEFTTLTAHTVNGDDTSWTWTSSDPVIATVSDAGVVHGLSAGAVTITATGNVTGVSGKLGVSISVDTPYRDLWAHSAHANVNSPAFTHWDSTGVVPAECARCHTTSGVQDYMGADGTAVDQTDGDHPAGGVIECTACHNATADNVDHVVFPSGVRIDNLGGEARCMTCHQGRASTDSVDAQIASANVDDDVISTSLHFDNIHNYAAGATLLAGQVRGGYQYEGETYDWRFRHAPEMEHCDDCHDQHSLQLRFDRCVTCHAGVTDLSHARDIRQLPSRGQDYDGNGNRTEGMYYEVQGMKAKLLIAIGDYPAVSGSASICYDTEAYPYWFKDTDSSGTTCDAAEVGFANAFTEWTPRLLRAAYNYQVSMRDPGSWAHNAKYVIELLHDSTADLNTVIALPVDLSMAARTDASHFNGSSEAARHWDEDEAVSATCSRCHSGSEGFRFFLTYGITKLVDTPDNGMDCYTCHENFSNFAVVNVPSVKLPSGIVRNFYGDYSNLCATCHQGRESMATVDAQIATGTYAFKNIHYFPAGSTLSGGDGQVGYQYPSKTYARAWEDHAGGSACVDCHAVTGTDHSHAIQANYARCHACHQQIQEIDDIKWLDRIGVDYDGDGDGTEQLTQELDAYEAVLMEQIQLVAYDNGHPICRASNNPYWFKNNVGTDLGEPCAPADAVSTNSYKSWTPELMRAAFNYQFSVNDPGGWAHNFPYMAELLYDSAEDLGGPSVVEGMIRPVGR